MLWECSFSELCLCTDTDSEEGSCKAPSVHRVWSSVLPATVSRDRTGAHLSPHGVRSATLLSQLSDSGLITGLVFLLPRKYILPNRESNAVRGISSQTQLQGQSHRTNRQLPQAVHTSAWTGLSKSLKPIYCPSCFPCLFFLLPLFGLCLSSFIPSFLH